MALTGTRSAQRLWDAMIVNPRKNVKMNTYIVKVAEVKNGRDLHGRDLLKCLRYVLSHFDKSPDLYVSWVFEDIFIVKTSLTQVQLTNVRGFLCAYGLGNQ